MAWRLDIDVLDSNSVDRAIRQLRGYQDWLDGYADTVAFRTASFARDVAYQHAHVVSGKMRDSIRPEKAIDGMYIVIADPVDEDTGEHYAAFEYNGGWAGSDWHEQQEEHGMEHEFFEPFLRDSREIATAIAMENYTW